MNKNNVLKFADDVFENVLKINDDLYKAELNFGNNSPAGIYYLDFNSLVKDVNFTEYQENLIADEYFKNRGNLQWNYYLLLLQDSLTVEKKKEIEVDDKYARKYVFNEAEFIDFFTIEKSEGEVQRDVVTDWKSRLDAIKFSEVYGKAPMTQTVERFYLKKMKAPVTPEFLDVEHDLIIESVDQISLTSEFRKFPAVVREFNFGKVNLISGINGVGKTSVLESIELLLCGKTLRNQGKKEVNGSVKGCFNKSLSDQHFELNNSSLYKSRDLYWYSNNNSRGNNLEVSFNRYNFFNSDAAYQFANTDDKESIMGALYNLVLGPEYNYIKDRIEKSYYNHLKPEYRRTLKEFEKFKLQRKDSIKEIGSLKKSGSLKKISSQIFKEFKELKIRFPLEDLETDYPDLEMHINEVISRLQEIEKLNKEPISKLVSSNKLKLVDKGLVHLLKFDESMNEKKDQENTLNSRRDELVENQDLIREASTFYENEKLFKIKGASHREKVNLRYSERISVVIDMTDGVDFSIIKSDESIESALKKIDVKVDIINNELILTNRSITTLSNKLGELEQIAKSIKRLGRDYLLHNENADVCPLCYSEFDVEELSKRIKRITEDQDIEVSKKLIDLHESNKKQKKLKEKLEKEKDLIVLLDECLNIMNPDNSLVEKKSISKCIIILNRNLKDSEKYEKERREINQLFLLFEHEGISENEFEIIESALLDRFPKISFSPKGKNEFSIAKNRNKKDIISNKKQLDTIQKSIESSIKVLKKIENIDQSEDIDISDLNDSYGTKKNRYERILDLFDDVNDLINIEDNKTSNVLLLSLNIIRTNIDQFKTELRNEIQLKNAKKLKDQAQNFLDKNKDKIKRLSVAIKELEKLMSEIDSNEHLTDFFRNNLKEIFGIFKTIHRPKEFVRMYFENSEIMLEDVNGQQRSISEISTGQRSALALSIFLCLNRKLKNGPKIIMFDDPISFIDDFNALSFLDFLRYMALKEDRQVFFATANLRLTSLFKKKFNFLDNSFKSWDLSRSD